MNEEASLLRKEKKRERKKGKELVLEMGDSTYDPPVVGRMI